MTEEIYRGAHVGDNGRVAEETDKTHESVREEIKEFLIDDAEIGETLDSINFDEIQRIFSEKIQKSIPDSEARAHTISRPDVFLVTPEAFAKVGNPDANPLMSYMPQYDVILVNVLEMRRVASMYNVPIPLLTVKLLMHEQAHAVSSHYDRQSRSGNRVVQIGVQQLHMQREGSSQAIFFNLLNEAINEKLARMVLVEYLKSNPLSGVNHEDIDSIADIYKKPEAALLFFAALHFLEALIAKISAKSHVEPDKVWQGLVHAEMMGLDLKNQKVRGMLDAAVGKQGFTDELSRLNVIDDTEKMVQLMSKYGLIHNFDKFKNAFVRGVLIRRQKKEQV
ncbi:hypothetical protein HY969_04800 [Candidatus Kaiserbacteria bacterium]|nr:hypothetical protein [Candidatus Kaiserbacteria bacterium]